MSSAVAVARSGFRGGAFQTDTAPALGALRPLANKLDTARLKRGDDLCQAVDNATHIAGTRFHTLDRGNRKTGKLGQGLLVDPEKRTGSTQLS